MGNKQAASIQSKCLTRGCILAEASELLPWDPLPPTSISLPHTQLRGREACEPIGILG